MRVARTKVLIPLACITGLFLVSGCTDYKKKYDYLNVEHQNLQGRYDNLQTTNQQLSEQVARDQERINDLQKQIDAGKKVGTASGFEGMDVAFDASAGTITVTLKNEILFDSGKATLKGATNKELDQVLSVLKQRYASRRVDVVGHTDSDPINKTKDKWQDNLSLSQARALSVAHYLMDHGVAHELILAGGCGEWRPRVANTSAANKAMNRRVEIVVHLRQAPKTEA
jgi:chemotaxis protein MotB